MCNPPSVGIRSWFLLVNMDSPLKWIGHSVNCNCGDKLKGSISVPLRQINSDHNHTVLSLMQGTRILLNSKYSIASRKKDYILFLEVVIFLSICTTDMYFSIWRSKKIILLVPWIVATAMDVFDYSIVKTNECLVYMN